MNVNVVQMVIWVSGFLTGLIHSKFIQKYQKNKKSKKDVD